MLQIRIFVQNDRIYWSFQEPKGEKWQHSKNVIWCCRNGRKSLEKTKVIGCQLIINIAEIVVHYRFCWLIVKPEHIGNLFWTIFHLFSFLYLDIKQRKPRRSLVVLVDCLRDVKDTKMISDFLIEQFLSSAISNFSEKN